MSETKKRKIWPYILIAFILVFGGISYAVYSVINDIKTHPAKLLETNFVQDIIKKKIGEQNAGLFAFAPHVLGLNEPRTFLVLFINDTELRPGGGFIGAYATIRMDGGKTEVLKMEGTEVLDLASDYGKMPDPPKVLKDYLKVSKWFLRDSNWSPDFAANAERALDFYAREGGVAHDQIDTVVGVTTHVIEALLEKTGPVTVDGITFNSENVIETLEHEVEIGFVDKKIPRKQRKGIMEPLMRAILAKLADNIFTQPDAYFSMIQKLGKEKDIMIYSKDPEFQKLIEEINFDGNVDVVAGDYLMWVDANMAALKTDHILVRELTRTLVSQDEGSYIGAATMKYIHNGTFDWRTTRYRDYVRIYVPKGSYVTSVNISDSDGTGKVLSHDEIDKGEEGSYAWFGTFFTIEPGHTKEVSFIYNVSDEVDKQIDAGSYNLFVQKQSGTGAPRLTLNLDFGKTITSAKPAEAEEKWGDTNYSFMTDMATDKQFEVKF